MMSAKSANTPESEPLSVKAIAAEFLKKETPLSVRKALYEDDDHVVEWCDCELCENWFAGGTNLKGWAPCINMLAVDAGTIQHNTVHECWGEGIHYLGDRGLIRGNVVYDTGHTGLYHQHGSGSIIERNLVYMTGRDEDFLIIRGGERSCCIRLTSEKDFNRRSCTPMADVVVRNNIMFGGLQNLAICVIQAGAASGFTNILLANNTCLNAVSKKDSTWCGNVLVDGTVVPNNVAWKNNIFLRDPGVHLPTGYELAPQASGKSSAMTWDYNLWWPAPGSGWQDSHDIYQNPLLVNGDTEAMQPGQVDETSFQLQAGSPAQGKGSTLAQIPDDFFGNRRTVDIGAHERSGVAGDPPPEPPPPPTPTGTSYYVATGGDDSNNGSENAPWRTIQHALRQVKAGDAIYIRSGTYQQGQIVINNQCATGTASNPILLIGYPGEPKPVIDGEYKYPEGPSAEEGGEEFVRSGLFEFEKGHNRSYYTFYGLKITHARGRGIRTYPGSRGIRVACCDFHDNRTSACQLEGDEWPPLERSLRQQLSFIMTRESSQAPPA